MFCDQYDQSWRMFYVFLRRLDILLPNLTLHLKQLEKEEQNNPKVSRRKEIIKIRLEINEKEMKESITKINKIKSWFFDSSTKKREGSNQQN